MQVRGAFFGNIWSSTLEAALHRIVQPRTCWNRKIVYRKCFRFRNMCNLLRTTCKNSFALVLSCPRKTQFSMYTNELAHYLGGLDRKAPFFLLRWWKGGTLQGTNVSPLKVAGKMTFLFAVVSFGGPFGGHSTCSWHDFHTTRFVFFENWPLW